MREKSLEVYHIDVDVAKCFLQFLCLYDYYVVLSIMVAYFMIWTVTSVAVQYMCRCPLSKIHNQLKILNSQL